MRENESNRCNFTRLRDIITAHLSLRFKKQADILFKAGLFAFLLLFLFLLKITHSSVVCHIYKKCFKTLSKAVKCKQN